MERITEPINVRTDRLISQLLGKNNKVTSLIYKENVFDALIVLYDECNNDNLKKNDKNIAAFVNKYRKVISELRSLRVNVYDFEVKKVIGRGNFGEVHLVKEKQTGDVYALKSTKKSECLDMKSPSYEEERNIMASTNSVWHTSLQYSFQDCTYLYLVMDYHPGGDLQSLLKRQGGTIPESAAKFYLSEMILAINDLHQMGFVHRDIKPDNILLDRLGHIKLADFGSSAKITLSKVVGDSLPVGTPDYVAPEVLQSIDSKYKQKSNYSQLCDYWSLGIIAYQLTVGRTPFACNSTSALYSKIMNHSKNWKYPPDIILSQAYVSFTKELITDQKNRLNYDKIIKHDLFKDVDFNTLKDQVPPFIPQISSPEDTSNFTEIVRRKSQPDIENFKSKPQFSGRNLPFVGFSFLKETQKRDSIDDVLPNVVVKDERVQNLLKEIDQLEKKLRFYKEVEVEKENLEKKLDEKCLKLESVQNVRGRLEQDLANTIAECSNLKRTLELERKNQSEIERKALNLIKSAKMKWENMEKNKISSLNYKIEECERKIEELTCANDILRNQLEQSLQMKSKQHESLEKVRSLNRQSVMKLEDLTQECQEQVVDLKNKLAEENYCKKILESKIEELKRSEEEFKLKIQDFENSNEYFNSEIKKRDVLIETLEHKISKIKAKDNEVNYLQSKINELTQKVQKTTADEKEIDLLKNMLKDEQNRSKLFQNEINELQKLVQKKEGEFKQQISKLQVNHENKLQEMRLQVKELLEDKEDLQKQVQQAQGHIETSVGKVKSLEELLARLENGVTKLENGSDRENVLKEQIERLEKQLVENHEKSALDKHELSQLKTKLWRIEKELNNNEIDKRILKRELKEAEDNAKQLSNDLVKLQAEMEENKKSYESALLELNQMNENLAEEVTKLRESRNALENTIKSEKDELEKRKNLVKELQNQIDSKNQEYVELLMKQTLHEKEKNSLKTELEATNKRTSELLKKIEEIVKDKTMTERQMEMYKTELNNSKMNYEALKEACSLLESQIIEYEKIIEANKATENDYCSRIEKLLNDLIVAKKEIQEAKRATNEEKSFRLLAETKNKMLQEELENLQKECDSYEEQCHEFKNYSNSLAEELTLNEEKINSLEVEIKSLERQVEDLYAENRGIKEDFSLQLTNLNRSKEMNYELLRQIAEYKEENLSLSDRVSQLETALVEKTNFYKDREIKNKATVNQHLKLIHFLQSKVEENKKKKTLTEKLFGHSKKENVNYLTYQSNKENEEKQDDKNMKTPRKKVQNGTVTQNSSARCRNNGFMDKNSNNKCPRPIESTTITTSGPTQQENVIIEGWIKTQNNTKDDWEKSYAILTPDYLNIYSQYPPNENPGSLLNSLELSQPETHGKIILEPVASEIDSPISEEDLLNVLKVEIIPNTTCWPPKSVIIMTSDPKEKEKWFKALQTVLGGAEYKYMGEKVASWSENVEVNCLVELTKDKKVLGTNQGLYVQRNDNLLHITTIPVQVHHITLIKALSIFVMIADTKRHLFMADLNLLESLSERSASLKPALPTKKIDVNGLNGFHIFQCSDFPRKMLACVATSKQLIVLNFDLSSRNFVLLRVLDTAEPTSCVLFLEHSILVGADKFFEVDLRSFEAEEFMDPSDPRLSHAVSYCDRNRSFPLFVAAIAGEKEFVLCFNAFATFVDAFGRATREREIKWARLPRGFHYHAPYLYVIQFSAVEVFKIGREVNDLIESYRIEMNSPVLLGGADAGGVYVGLGREARLIEGKEIDEGGCGVSGIVEDETTGSEFSFTSSMVQSLDGISCEDVRTDKRVNFTDL